VGGPLPNALTTGRFPRENNFLKYPQPRNPGVPAKMTHHPKTLFSSLAALAILLG
jgi:hypothetical protein